MTDTPVIHIDENSPEKIAYQLFLHVVRAEGKHLGSPTVASTVDRDYILQTYAACLLAATRKV